MMISSGDSTDADGIASEAEVQLHTDPRDWVS